MKRTLTVNPVARTLYVPKDLIDQGYVDEVVALVPGNVVVLVHPGADPSEVLAALALVAQFVKLEVDNGRQPAHTDV